MNLYHSLSLILHSRMLNMSASASEHYLVCLVYLVEQNEPDEPNKPVSFRAIDEIAWSRGRIGGDLLGVAGGNIFLQSLQELENLHVGRSLA
jgi:hypothetical protein